MSTACFGCCCRRIWTDWESVLVIAKVAGSSPISCKLEFMEGTGHFGADRAVFPARLCQNSGSFEIEFVFLDTTGGHPDHLSRLSPVFLAPASGHFFEGVILVASPSPAWTPARGSLTIQSRITGPRLRANSSRKDTLASQASNRLSMRGSFKSLRISWASSRLMASIRDRTFSGRKAPSRCRSSSFRK